MILKPCRSHVHGNKMRKFVEEYFTSHNMRGSKGGTGGSIPPEKSQKI